MARIRSIYPSTCTSFEMAVLSDAAERTFFRLLTHADDQGRGIDHPKLLKAALFPLNDEKTDQVVDDLMTELEAAGRVIRYQVLGARFFEVVNFGEHQKPKHPQPSKIPAPDVDTGLGNRSPVSSRTAPDCSSTGDVAGTLRDGSLHVGVDVVVDVEGGGGDTPESSGTPDLLRKDADPSLLEEADEMIAVLVDQHGQSRVDTAAAALTARRLRFQWPRELKAALERELAKTPLRKIEGGVCSHEGCVNGWISGEPDEAGYSTSSPCPKCSVAA